MIFRADLREDSGPGYEEAAARMLAFAEDQPGYLGADSVRDADGAGITVSYWRTQADIVRWREQLEHAATREQGRKDWYARYTLRVTKVVREYDWDSAE